MAEITFNNVNMIVSTAATTEVGRCATALNVGDIVYFNESAQRWDRAQSDAQSTAGASGSKIGIVASGAVREGEQVIICTDDPNLTLGTGAGLVVGVPLFLSAAVSGSMNDAAPAQGNYITVLMHPTSTTAGIFRPLATNAPVA